MARGVYIVFEGIDGSGITTHSRYAAEYYNARYVKMPTPFYYTLIGMLGGEDRVNLLDRFFAHVLDHYHVDASISVAVARGVNVIGDRSIVSSLAYQGALGLNQEWMLTVLGRTRLPDMVIYLDVPVEVACKRIHRRGSGEDCRLLPHVKRAYEDALKLIESHGIRVYRVSGVDAAGRENPINETRRLIHQVLDRWLW